MMQNEIKQRLQLLGKPGIKKVMLDLLIIVASDNDWKNDGVGVSDLYRYVEDLHKRLKGQYRKQLQVEDIKVHQTDLESLIEIVKKEETQKIIERINEVKHE